VAEGGGLLNRYRVVKPYRGFESLRLRQFTRQLFDLFRFSKIALGARAHPDASLVVPKGSQGLESNLIRMSRRG
jgi:hypothetical protein